MLKKTLYPKTKRIDTNVKTQITEKLDGSNLLIGKTINNELFIAQRNYIFYYTELEDEEIRSKVYAGLYGWLKENGVYLSEHIMPNSVICGEWLGMGKLPYLKYKEEFPNRFYIYAKGNLAKNEEWELTNTYYNHDLFKYMFDNKEIPSFIGVVPVVSEPTQIITIGFLDKLYEEYTTKVGRKVEGFVINENDGISKYVRMKNGVLQEHFDWNNN